jgi:hypothetical protein
LPIRIELAGGQKSSCAGPAKAEAAVPPLTKREPSAAAPDNAPSKYFELMVSPEPVNPEPLTAAPPGQ